MKMRDIVLLLCALLIVTLINSCTRSENASHEQTNMAQENVKVVPVEIFHVRPGNMTQSITATGTIRPFRQAYVASEASGRITRVNFEVGQHVEIGELLVQLDEELLSLGADQAEAQKMQAKATYEKAVKDLERNEKLYSEGSITEFELETARVNEQVSKSNYLLAEASLKMAKRQLSDTRIASPISGEVAERSVDVGETVAPGTPVVKIVETDRLRVNIGLSAEQIVKVRKGQGVELTVEAYPGIPFEGKVFTVGPEASPDTRTFPVEILIQNSRDHPLKAGMVARVRVAVEVIKDVPLIPRDAILERSGEYIAYVVNGDEATKRTLDIGAQAPDMIEIREGIAIGEDVVVVGQENLSDGTKVTVQNNIK
ncbi:MAG: efflux RND transporter periplasmic adaptor subunit [Gemmatimonadota bacterium]|nr:MAG: efflux RND transporter periplasmic adaptor subunit [Gemmatimonadota bacterium]